MAEKERLGAYRLVRPLGRGGMAEVFLAESEDAPADAPPVVVKRILPELAADQRFVNLFLREGRMAMRMEHPNLVRVHEIGRADHERFLVMEFLDGLSLRDAALRLWRRGDTLPIGAALRACADAALGLAHAHALTEADGTPTPLIHRDISPDNIVLCRDGTSKVVDFGLARTMQEEDNLTRSTELRGKLSYMAPEYLQGLTLDGRADVFSLGVTLYWLLTRRSPFRGETDALTIVNVLSMPTPDPLAHAPDLPPDVVALLLRALEKDRERRVPSALAFHDELAALHGVIGDATDAARLAASALDRTSAEDSFDEPTHAATSEPVPRGETLLDGPIADLTTVVTPDAPAGDRTLRVRLVDVAGRDTTLEGAPLPFASALADTLAMPRVPAPTAEQGAVERPQRRSIGYGAIAAAAVLVVVTLVAAFAASDTKTSSNVVAVRTEVAVDVATASAGPTTSLAEERPPTDEPEATAAPNAHEDDNDDDDDGRESPPSAAAPETPARERGVDRPVARAADRAQRTPQRTKRRPAREPPTPTRDAVRVQGPRSLRWLADGRPVSVVRGAVRVPPDTSSLEAIDPRTGGRSRVPVVDGVADYGKLRKGTAFFLVRPWAEVRIGAKNLGATPFDPVSLPEGRYQAELRLDGRTVTRAFAIDAGKQTTIRVNMTDP